MIRSFRFVLRPTAKQTAALAAMLEDHRQLYNAALAERRYAYRMRGVSVQYVAQSAQLREIRSADPDGQGRWSAGSQQQTLRRLDKAFQAFFRRVKSGAKAGYPRFKSRERFRSVDWPARKNGARWNSGPDGQATRAYLLGIGHVRVHQHRPIEGNVKAITVKQEGRRWIIIILCDAVPTKPLAATGSTVGIDLGVASFLTTSHGEHVTNPRAGRKMAHELTAAQRALSRCTRRSRRRGKIRSRIIRLNAKIARQRRDRAHKVALALVQQNDIIVHEALKIMNMTSRPAPRPNENGTFEANGAASKSGLNRSIMDAGWGMFLTILSHKAESAGRTVIAVNPRNTSRTCNRCGNRAKANRVSQAVFRCTACGHCAHADVNAAENILRAGLVLHAAQHT